MFAHDKLKSNFYIYYRLFLWYNGRMREMKKKFAFLMALVVGLTGFSATTVAFEAKKASSVKQQEKSGLESVTSGSLLPGVIGLVTNVAALNKQTQELAAECVPTSAEITWVNNMVKEYAKIADITADDMRNKIGTNSCVNDSQYVQEVQTNRPANQSVCVPVFNEEVNVIWWNYPRANYAKYCAGDVTFTCGESKKKTETNFYDVFASIDFAEEDYTLDEATMYKKLVEKTEKCAPGKVAQRQKEAYATFLKGTIAGAGTSTNTGGIMDAVGGLTSGGGLSGIGTLGTSVMQFLDK